MPKFSTAAEDVPALLTVADAPADRVETVPTAIVAAEPSEPLEPFEPSAPLGIPKLKTAAEDVPAFETVADPPADTVETVPTAMVAAVPSEPSEPLVPAFP